MNSEQFPIIRIELQSMKHTIMKAFSETNDEIEKAVNVALEEVVKPENVKRIVMEKIEREANEILGRMVSDAMQKLLWDDVLKEDLAHLVRKSVSGKLREASKRS